VSRTRTFSDAIFHACQSSCRESRTATIKPLGAKKDAIMSTVAEILVESLVKAGVKRIYGIVGDSLNGITDALRRKKSIHGSMCAMRR